MCEAFSDDQRAVPPVKRLAGKVAMITGAARGQGAREASLFAAEGANVVLTDVLETGAEVAAQLGKSALFLDRRCE